MRMEKYGCFMQMYVYYYWNHTQHRAWRLDIVFQRTCSCLLDTWKKKYKVPITSLSLHWSIYWHKPVYMFAHRPAHFFWTCKMYIAYIVYYYICLHLCAHILYFDAAKFSIKQFSLIYFTVSVVRQWNEYEKVIETRPIMTK